MFVERSIYCPVCNFHIGKFTNENIYNLMKCKGCKSQFQFKKDSIQSQPKESGSGNWTVTSIDLSANVCTDGFKGKVSKLFKERVDKQIEYDKIKSNSDSSENN